MARSGYQKRRVSSSGRTQNRRTYEDGNAVRKLYAMPEEPARESRKAANRGARSKTRAAGMSMAYVLFLTAVCVVTLFVCVHYLQLRSQLTQQNRKIAVMQSDLSKLRADNDAYFKKTLASVTLDEIKETALNRLDMHYAAEAQIRYYSLDDAAYVRQYRDVTGQTPGSGA